MSAFTAVLLFNSIAIVANTIIIALNNRVITRVANEKC